MLDTNTAPTISLQQAQAVLPELDALLARATDALRARVGGAKIDAEALSHAPQLKIVARAGVGLDNVEIPAATKAGVMVVNAPTSNIVSAAELAIAHLLGLARHIPAADASLKRGEWKRSAYTGVELYEKTVGIVGLGRIGALAEEEDSERLHEEFAAAIHGQGEMDPSTASQMAYYDFLTWVQESLTHALLR